MCDPALARPVERIRAAVADAAPGSTTVSRRTIGNGAPSIKKAKLQVLSGLLPDAS